MQNLDLKFVYKALSSQEKESVIALWTSVGVVSYAEALRRVEEVSTLILFENIVIGVSTVYLAKLQPLDKTYFFCRMFVKEEYRGDNGMRKKLLRLNFLKLKESYADVSCGLVLELENQKFARLGEHTNYMTKRGYTYHGKSQRGLQLWYVDFDEPKGIFSNI